VKDDFDVTIGNIGHLEPLGDDKFHLTGHLTGENWYCHGSAIDCKGDIEWDLVVDRVYGFYGQREIEKETHFDPIISWNTYAHDSKVSGHISYVAEHKKWTFDEKTCKGKCRAYGDMNWGMQFPQPPKNDIGDLRYAWG